MSFELNFSKAVKKFNEIIDKPVLLEEFCEKFRSEPIPTLLKIDEKVEGENKKFILKYISRNMNQFKRFLEILLHTGQNDAINMIASEYLADILDLSRCHPKSKFIDTFSFGYKNSRDELIKIERSESSSGARFAMDSEPRGFCVLINNYLTYGTYVEMQRFRNIFYQLHFEVIMKQNLNFDETNRLLDGISKSDQLKEHSAIIFMILSHGTKEKEFLSFDKKGIKIDYLVNKFCNQNCPALLDKPRIYILNCCRGDEDDFGFNVEQHSNFADPSAVLEPSLDNIESCERKPDVKTGPNSKNDNKFVCYTTLDGLKAYVNWDNGTDFGNVFADTLVEKAWYKNLSSIFTRVNNKLEEINKKHFSEGKKSANRVIEWISSPRRSFYFNPKEPNIIPYPN